MRSGLTLTLAVMVASLPFTGDAVWAQAAPEPLSVDALSAISAGEAPQVNVATRQNIDALNGGNSISADAVNTGGVNFADGAFEGFNGVGNVVVNTGNNNIIQGTLSVTITSGIPQ